MSLLEIWEAGCIERFHATPGMPGQTVARHSWGVAMILLHLYPDARGKVVMAALAHDVGERVTGDVPAPAKWADKELNDKLDLLERHELKRLGLYVLLTTEERRRIKACDGIELMFQCLHQRRMGNSYADLVFNKIRSSLIRQGASHTRLKAKERELVDCLTATYEKIGGLINE